MSPMLKPIESTGCPTALALLCEGFPSRSRQHWLQLFQNMELFGGNQAASVAYGQIYEAKGKPVGVILTPASLRKYGDGPCRRVINFASWYVDPAHRWLAPLMLRSVSKDNDAIYTDLTPTEPVQKMLPAMGFTPLSRGVTVALSPLVAAMRNSGIGSVVPLRDSPIAELDPATAGLLARHEEFGCHAMALNDGASWTPILFKFRRIKHLPSAVLVYCGDNQALHRNLPAVARYLLKRGRLALVMDLPCDGPTVPGFDQPGKTPRFVKGFCQPNKTDYCGSELAIF